MKNTVQDVHLYEFEDFRLNTKGDLHNRLFRNAQSHPIRDIEFLILCILVENHGREVSWKYLCKKVWGEKSLEERGIRNRLQKQIGNLRDNIGHDKIKRTDNGYCFAIEVVEIRDPKENSDDPNDNDLNFVIWIFKNIRGRKLTIFFSAGIAITILYLIVMVRT